MIWGKTHEEEIRLRLIYCWLPTPLEDGRWIWFEHAWRRITHYGPVFTLKKPEPMP